MKIFQLFCVLIVLNLTACMPAPRIYKPTDSDHATGELKPLSSLIPGGTSVRLFFIHGVGDHCPGYVFDADTGWLRNKNLTEMGMSAVGAPGPLKSINVSIFMGGETDSKAKVFSQTQLYELTLPDRTNKVNVEAIEITWSPLTQWIKSNQLGYDSPSAFGVGTRCVEPIDPKITKTVQAPSRMWFNETIKEKVFDRNLSDAILYAGSYGKTMERGLAEAVCHSVVDIPDNQKCTWLNPESFEEKRYVNFFVTHSLGSRMTYDMFIDLLGKTTDQANPFTPIERDAARGYLETMIANTPAFYMMANQLALLGLANVPPEARSAQPVAHPFSEKHVRIINRADIILDKPDVIQSDPMGDPIEQISELKTPRVPFGNVLQKIVQLKDNATNHRSGTTDSLQIVSFNDTNDLLTWHIPSWYADDDANDDEKRTSVKVADVFVGNAPRLFFFENPTKAHVDYFINSSVWNVIRCGAQNGKVLSCP
jgi:hypothetical protein